MKNEFYFITYLFYNLYKISFSLNYCNQQNKENSIVFSHLDASFVSDCNYNLNILCNSNCTHAIFLWVKLHVCKTVYDQKDMYAKLSVRNRTVGNGYTPFLNDTFSLNSINCL